VKPTPVNWVSPARLGVMPPRDALPMFVTVKVRSALYGEMIRLAPAVPRPACTVDSMGSFAQDASPMAPSRSPETTLRCPILVLLVL